jgi:glycosyltransferase involved in cell wall biosynthesis
MYASLPICDLPIRKIVTVGDMIPRLAWRYGSFYQAIKSNIALMRNRFLPLISRSLNERGIKTADAILTFSECSKQDIVELLGVGQEKVYVVPISVDRKLRPEPSNVVSSILEKYNIITSYILHVGGFAPHKNVINLIEAYNLLSTNSKRSTKLVIVGSCPPPRIINRIAQLGLTNNILFVSGVKRDHRSALYSGAKMLVYPSLYEGFGLPPLEAMSCGCPVITSNTSSIPEVVGNAAITVNPNDSIAISKAIELILNDGRVAADLREQGLERAQRFSWDHCVAETCRIYDQLLSS